MEVGTDKSPFETRHLSNYFCVPSTLYLPPQVQLSSLCMCVTVSATVVLCLMFGPKVYLVRLIPLETMLGVTRLLAPP